MKKTSLILVSAALLLTACPPNNNTMDGGSDTGTRPDTGGGSDAPAAFDPAFPVNAAVIGTWMSTEVGTGTREGYMGTATFTFTNTGTYTLTTSGMWSATGTNKPGCRDTSMETGTYSGSAIGDPTNQMNWLVEFRSAGATYNTTGCNNPTDNGPGTVGASTSTVSVRVSGNTLMLIGQSETISYTKQ